MQKRINVGIIGLGKVGAIRKQIIERHPNLCLCGLCDVKKPDPNCLSGIPFFYNYSDLLETDIDAVFVATPNKITPEIVIAALNRSKHVFCEKPPGRTVEDIRNIIGSEKRNKGCILKFGFNHRYHGSVMEAKRMIRSGKFGKILWMRGVYGKSGGINFEKGWRSDKDWAGGGILLDQGIHMIDLFRFFIGDFEEIKSFVTTSYWDIDLEDNAFALLRTKNDQVAFLHSSSTQWKHTFLLEIGLEGGYVNLQGILSSTRSYGQGEKLVSAKKQFESETFALGNPHESVTIFDKDCSWELEIEEFIDCIMNKKKVKNGNSLDALKAIQIVYGIYDDGKYRKRSE